MKEIITRKEALIKIKKDYPITGKKSTKLPNLNNHVLERLLSLPYQGSSTPEYIVVDNHVFIALVNLIKNASGDNPFVVGNDFWKQSKANKIFNNLEALVRG